MGGCFDKNDQRFNQELFRAIDQKLNDTGSVKNVQKFQQNMKEIVFYIYSKIKLNFIESILNEIREHGKLFVCPQNVNVPYGNIIVHMEGIKKYFEVIQNQRTDFELREKQIRKEVEKMQRNMVKNKKIVGQIPGSTQSRNNPEKAQVFAVKRQQNEIQRQRQQIMKNAVFVKNKNQVFEQQVRPSFNVCDSFVPTSYSIEQNVKQLQDNIINFSDEIKYSRQQQWLQKIDVLKQQLAIAHQQINQDEQKHELKLKKQVGLVDSFKKDCEQSKARIEQLLKQNKKLFSKGLSLQIEVSNLQLKNAELIKQIDGLRTKRQNQLQKRQENLKQVRQNQQLKQSSSISTNSSSVSKVNLQFLYLLKYFCTTTLLPNFHNVDLASRYRRSIIEMFNQQVVETKLLYAFEQVGELHYEPFVREEEDLVLLVGLSSGVVVGGFAGEVDQNEEISGSFLFSIRENGEAIKLTTEKKIKRITHQNGFLSFGYGEIKIKAKTLRFSCNVSGLQPVYSWGNKQIQLESFYGTEEREPTINGYQIHKVIFQKARE